MESITGPEVECAALQQENAKWKSSSVWKTKKARGKPQKVYYYTGLPLIELLNVVFKFVSKYGGISRDDLQYQLKALYDSKKSLEVKVQRVQQQQGTSDCGLFAIAYLFSLASRSDPAKQKYKEPDMRKHLLTCLKEKTPKPLPLERLVTRVARPDVHII